MQNPRLQEIIKMKNVHVEDLKRRAKQYHRAERGGHSKNDIMFFHRYDGLPTDRLTWWDDVHFILNDYRVMLAWIHPRMAFEDAIECETDRLTAHLPFEDFMHEGTPVYETIGTSRKKIISIEYETLVQTDDWRDQCQRARQQAMQSANFEIKPFLKSNWCTHSRVVDLCVPIEVRHEDDLQQLVTLARRLLKREVTLSEAFPGYLYTRADWEKEGLHIAGNDLHVHGVA